MEKLSLINIFLGVVVCITLFFVFFEVKVRGSHDEKVEKSLDTSFSVKYDFSPFTHLKDIERLFKNEKGPSKVMLKENLGIFLFNAAF